MHLTRVTKDGEMTLRLKHFSGRSRAVLELRVKSEISENTFALLAEDGDSYVQQIGNAILNKTLHLLLILIKNR